MCFLCLLWMPQLKSLHFEVYSEDPVMSPTWLWHYDEGFTNPCFHTAVVASVYHEETFMPSPYHTGHLYVVLPCSNVPTSVRQTCMWNVSLKKNPGSPVYAMSVQVWRCLDHLSKKKWSEWLVTLATIFVRKKEIDVHFPCVCRIDNRGQLQWQLVWRVLTSQTLR